MEQTLVDRCWLHCFMVWALPFHCPSSGGACQKAASCYVSQSWCGWFGGESLFLIWLLVIIALFIVFSRVWYHALYLGSCLNYFLYLQKVAEEFEVKAMPTFLFFKDGKQIDKVVGAKKEELQQKVMAHSSAAAVAAAWVQ